MKQLFLFGISILLLSACSNDFDVTADWKEVPVVYGILSPKDTATYIRIEKAFLDEKRSALEVSKIADSLYYPADAIAVYLEKKGSPQTRIQLAKVDGVSEGITRAEGIFATQPNWLYKYKHTNATAYFETGKRYLLTIERKDGKPKITAETVIPGEFKFTSPDESNLLDRTSFSERLPTTFEWRCDSNGVLFNLDLIIRFREVNPTNGVVVAKKELYLKGGRNLKASPNSSGQWGASYQLFGSTFFKFLRDNIDSTQNYWRYFEPGSIVLEGGGSEINKYLEAAQVNSGITGAEVVNSYTNISEGFGIFTAKNEKLFNKLFISSSTVDSMNASLITRKLNFRY